PGNTHKNCSYGRPEQAVLLGTSTRPLARTMHVITSRRWAIPILGTFSPKQTWAVATQRRPFFLKPLFGRTLEARSETDGRHRGSHQFRSAGGSSQVAFTSQPAYRRRPLPSGRRHPLRVSPQIDDQADHHGPPVRNTHRAPATVSECYLVRRADR